MQIKQKTRSERWPSRINYRGTDLLVKCYDQSRVNKKRRREWIKGWSWRKNSQILTPDEGEREKRGEKYRGKKRNDLCLLHFGHASKNENLKSISKFRLKKVKKKKSLDQSYSKNKRLYFDAKVWVYFYLIIAAITKNELKKSVK